MGELHFEQRVVTGWGHAAEHSGEDVGGARRTVITADDDAGYARAAGLAVRGASNQYTAGIESGVTGVAGAVSGIGDKLLATVGVVTSTDDADADLFVAWNGGRR